MPDRIPCLRSVDVLVVGGATCGVAAAVAAAREGASVFLAATESYLGEDLCATGRLWSAQPTAGRSELADGLFAGGADGTLPYPMTLKNRLDSALIDAGVGFLFGLAPTDVLQDRDGHPCGVVFGSRSGLVAVAAAQIIDATPSALVARMAGEAFTAWPGGILTMERVVAGPRADTTAEGDEVRTLDQPLAVRLQADDPESARRFDVHVYRLAIDVPEDSPQAFEEAEQVARDRTWHPDQIWSSDRLYALPPVQLEARAVAEAEAETPELDHCRGVRDGLWVLGPRSGFSRATAQALMDDPAAGIAFGERVGRAAASEGDAPDLETVAGCVSAQGEGAMGVREPMRIARYEDLPALEGAARAVPVLDRFDVVVVGGGTGGAPAGIAAAREGARTLVLEAAWGLGGVGTLGFICIYYHGYREGFTREVDAGVATWADPEDTRRGRWNPEHKMEWLRRELRTAGATTWFGALTTGAVVEGDAVRGVVVATPWGYGVIEAGVVIDCTGNADVASAAGAPCTSTGADHVAVQGSGLPGRPPVPSYNNTDYTFIEDADLLDTWRAFVVGRRKFAERNFDMGQLLDTRERRQIIGDVVVTPEDVYSGRTWSTSVALSRSNFDTHGFTIHPMFLVKPPDRKSLDAYIPLGALTPRGIRGLLATGLGLSAHRDVMPVLRMQACVQNHSYAAGLIAAAALAHDGEVRDIDLPAMRRRLADLGILPAEALEAGESFPIPDARVANAAAGDLDNYPDLAAILARADASVPLLRERHDTVADDDVRLAAAKLLAILGDDHGTATLCKHIAASAWDDGWNYRGMGQFGASLSPLDTCIIAASMTGRDEVVPLLIEKIEALDAEHGFSHHRAVAVAAERLHATTAAPALAALLRKPGMQGHAWTTLAEELRNIPESHVDTETRNVSLRELILARALYRCGDTDGVGETVLKRYREDIRGHFSRHARAVLAAGVEAPTAMAM